MQCWRPSCTFVKGARPARANHGERLFFSPARNDSGLIAGFGTRCDGVCASQSLRTRENGSPSPAALALGLLRALADAVLHPISESVLALLSGGVCAAARLSQWNARPNAPGKRAPAPPTAPPPLPAPASGHALSRCAPGTSGSAPRAPCGGLRPLCTPRTRPALPKSIPVDIGTQYFTRGPYVAHACH